MDWGHKEWKAPLRCFTDQTKSHFDAKYHEFLLKHPWQEPFCLGQLSLPFHKVQFFVAQNPSRTWCHSTFRFFWEPEVFSQQIEFEKPCCSWGQVPFVPAVCLCPSAPWSPFPKPFLSCWNNKKNPQELFISLTQWLHFNGLSTSRKELSGKAFRWF